MPKQPCQLCQVPDLLEHRQVKRIDLAPIVEGRMLPTGMMVCSRCREAIDGAQPLVWLEGGFVFWKFSDGAFASRTDLEQGKHVIIDLPDETTYQPGRSSFPRKIFGVTEIGP